MGWVKRAIRLWKHDRAEVKMLHVYSYLVETWTLDRHVSRRAALHLIFNKLEEMLKERETL